MFAEDSGDVLLASGSQDNYIRIWRISSRDKCSSPVDQLRLKQDSFTIDSPGLCSFTVKFSGGFFYFYFYF